MKKRYAIPVIISVIMVLLNVISRFSTGFADFYVTKIFPYISNVLSFISGIFPFSFGELLIATGILFVIIGVPVFIVLVIVKKSSRRKIISIFSSAVMWIFTYIITTETMNCFIMYQCTPFSERYFSTSQEHTRSELVSLYEKLINDANMLAEEVKRDGEGHFVLSDDLAENAKEAMKRAAETYPQLKGYYPDPKPVLCSYFMSQSGIQGIYFPFTMESNYNADMCEVNLPDTICHEYAHLKGIIQEDEAGFIAYIASSKSDSADFRYSGCLNALQYVHNQVYHSEITEAYYLTDTISQGVKNDWFRFLPENYWEENKEKEIISTDTVDTISSAATDTTLKANGVKDGIESYSRIVNLLLDYYG